MSIEEVDVGTVLDDLWRLEWELGRGGMGIVYAAQNLRTGGRVAIKVLGRQCLGDAAAIARFAREAELVSRLTSRHVARVEAIGMLADGVPFIVMEMLEGEDLANVLRERQAPLGIREAIDQITQACDGVAEAHALGIVHRDLKLQNLFIARSEGRTAQVVKVLDFGIAKDNSRNARHLSLTDAGAMLGTPNYMAPEMFSSPREVDARCDVWALGVCLYRLLTDDYPFDASSFIRLYRSVMEASPQPPSSIRHELPPVLDDIVMRCLRFAREDRYESAGDLADTLRDARDVLRSPSRPSAMRPAPTTLTRVLACPIR